MQERLDIYLVEHEMVKSRSLATSIIRSGGVSVNGAPCIKSAYIVKETDNVELTGELPKYVGRGGLKLETAVREFGLNLNGLTCMDVGASTGGFTDCMLQNGAKRVYAVDVDTDQLDDSLRKDGRVVSMEQTDIRSISGFSVKPDFISVDVSFISLKQVLPTVYNLLKHSGSCVALIKPQFEAGRKNLNKKGIVRDKKVHQKVCEDISEFSKALGFKIIGLVPSDIFGGDGNTEFLIYLQKNEAE